MTVRRKEHNGLVRSISESMDWKTRPSKNGRSGSCGSACLGVSHVPVSRTSLLSRALFWWMWRIMLGLYRNGLACLMSLEWWEEDTTEFNVQLLEKAWNTEMTKHGPNKASLFRAMRTAYKIPIIKATAVIYITLSFSFIGSAFILRMLLGHISTDSHDTRTGVIIVLSLILCEFCRSFNYSLAWSYNYVSGMRGRAAAMGLLYKKILKLRSLQDKNIGELVNMFSHDGQRVFEALVNGPFVFGGPFIFLSGAIYLTVIMGWWALVGIATYILVFIIIKFLTGGTEHYRKIAMNLTGQRVGLITEVLTCMKLIKMNGWDLPFIGRITRKRKEEKSALERGSFFKSVVTSLVPMIPVIASVVMFLGYILSGNPLDATKAFTTISVFYAMSFSLATALYGVQTLIDVRVAEVRYKEILLMPESSTFSPPRDDDIAVELKATTLTWEAEDENEFEPTDEDSVIAGLMPEEVRTLSSSSTSSTRHQIIPEQLEDQSDDSVAEKSSSSLLPKVTLTENSETDLSDRPALTEINLTVKKGQLVGICGMKGSGKTSLLVALLGRLQLLEGELSVSGTAAYSSQDPWIVTGTARENILFGLPYEKERYDKVIQATKLEKDFETFSAGDEVEIGDRGITLSGGQKQRVCLARALYSNCDIYLLDDPLSAVDVNMGRHIFAQCIKTILHGKTVFLVTHHLEYLPKCDRVLFLQDGKVSAYGPHPELMCHGGPYAELFSLYNSKYDRILKDRRKSRIKSDVKTVIQRGFSRVSKKTLARQLTRMSTITASVQHQFSVVSSTSMCAEYENVDIDDIVASRDQPDCHVRSDTFLTYIRAMGGIAIFLFLLVSFIVSIVIQSLTTSYLAYWLNQGAGDYWQNVNTSDYDNFTLTEGEKVLANPHLNAYALVYGMLLVAMLVILVARSLIFVKILLKASTALHRNLVEMTLKSPMSFFDTTPIGIILNRFSADMDEVDVRLPANCELFLQNVFLVLSALVMITIVFPFDLLAILPLVVIFGLLANMFAPVLQQLKFMDNITRSPYISHLASSVEGVSTIIAFGQGERFYAKFCELVNKNSVPFFLFYAANRWLAVFLDSMTIIVTGVTGFLIVFTFNTHNSSEAGLALSFAIQITSLVQYTLRLSMETVSRLSSVQRIQDYVELLQPEGSNLNNPVTVPPDWPSEGSITFKQYKMRYLDGQAPVLKGISLNIQSKEKIGIVGNSGAGKSSLGVGLFRLAEASAGTILIDGVNIRDIPLPVLRSRLSILVQDPVLFTGTVRYNLDPSGAILSDDLFWQALDKCHIKAKIQSLEKGLETMVDENGRNFSMGERQLLCLARTLLRNSKILVLDEATSSVDANTEQLVQKTIRECFHNCTVLMIAHRINTVWDCDKVLVLEGGKAVEFNHPSVLLQKSYSRFKTMFDVMKSIPRGASINDDTDIVPVKPHGSPCIRQSTSPRNWTPSAGSSFGADFSPLQDSVIFDDDENHDINV